MGEKCVDASFVPFCDLAFQFGPAVLSAGAGLVIQVGRGLVPHQPCFGVLTAGTRESTPFALGLARPLRAKPRGVVSWAAKW